MNKQTDSKFFLTLSVVPLSIIIGFILGLYQAYVVSQVWGWFAVGRLGLPALPVLVVYGLLLGVNVAGLTGRPMDPKGDTVLERMTDTITGSVVRTSFGWLFAYIIYCLVTP